MSRFQKTLRLEKLLQN
uniref:Uncharacterized protein n=1 Tax=Arundo donax TaxID=35708 RepID=A0A0A8YWR7_ARUDO